MRLVRLRRSSNGGRSTRRRRRGRSSRGRVRLWQWHAMTARKRGRGLTLGSQEVASARRLLRIAGGWRRALVADTLGLASPFEQQSSPESQLSSVVARSLLRPDVSLGAPSSHIASRDGRAWQRCRSAQPRSQLARHVRVGSVGSPCAEVDGAGWCARSRRRSRTLSCAAMRRWGAIVTHRVSRWTSVAEVSVGTAAVAVGASLPSGQRQLAVRCGRRR